jgi:omega-amidase
VAEPVAPATAGADAKLYNTCTVWDPTGALIAKHRKMHLFDIDIPGRITFKESDSLTAGDSLSSFTTPWGKIGLGICYDLRFPQLSNILRFRDNCDMLIFPGAFNTTTGPAHWELLLRSRAVDNQLFVLACSPARNPDASYQAYGHSSVVDPWGEVVATTSHEEDIVTATIDSEQVKEVRTRIPVSQQRREDVYVDVAWKGSSEGIMDATRAACARVPSTLGGFFSLG